MNDPRLSGASRNPVTDNLDLWTSALLVKSTAGRGNHGRLEAYGIKKLRALILELAVRGTLVAQDSADEPASSLLKLARNEKAKLAAAGDRKREIKTQEIVDSEKPFELPAGWAFARLGDLALSVKSGGTPSKHDPRYWGGGIPWASVKDLGFGDPISDTQDRITEAGLEAGSCLAEAGSLLICTRMGLGKIGEALIDTAINQDLKAVRLVSVIDKQYFITFYKTIAIAGTGMTVAGIKQEELLNFVIPLPPLEEQRRIVAKVDELMALCDQLEQQQGRGIEAHQTLVETLLGTLTNVASAQEFAAAWSRIAEHFDTLFTTEHSIDQLKQTILQLAVMGKLVSQDPTDEPANLLLRRRFEEKVALVKQKKARVEKLLPTVLDNEKGWELPVGWEWERLGNIFNGGSGTTPLRSNTSYFMNGTENWFKTTDLNLGVVTEGEEKITKQAVTECNLAYYPPGTVCIAMYGGAGTIGKSGMLGVESTINQSVFALPPVNQIAPEYLHVFVKTVRDKWMQYAAGLRKDPNINGLIIKQMVMPIPPLAEQRRIVAKVDELMALCDALKARLAEAQTTQIRLADAIVERAVAAPEAIVA